MRYEFEYATIEECLEALVDRLDAAGDDAVFTHAVPALGGVYVLAAGGAPAPDPERYPQLSRRVVAALARNRPRLRGYLTRMLTAAQAVPEYAEAAFRRCCRRSATTTRSWPARCPTATRPGSTGSCAPPRRPYRRCPPGRCRPACPRRTDGGTP
jgi:hypothetical protein